MKLSTFTAKLTCGTTKILSIAGGLALAGAALTLAAPTASAQHVAFGIQIGGPRYVARAPVYVAPAPVYVAPAYGYVAPEYWQPRRDDDWRVRQDWDRHHEVDNRPMPYRGR